MAAPKGRLGVLLVMSMSVFATQLSAQSVALSFAELQPLLKEGQTVIVTDGAGRTTRGKLTDLSPSSFSLVSATERTPHVFGDGALSARLQRDSLKNGIGIGIGAAVVTAFVSASRQCASPNDCTAYAGSFGLGLLTSALYVPAGIGIGALVDWLARHDELHVDYRIERASSRRSLRISPLIGKERRGVSMSVGR